MTEPISQPGQPNQPDATTANVAASENLTEPIELQPDADERLQVLRLLEGGDITADEADALLDALDEQEAAEPLRTAGRQDGGTAGIATGEWEDGKTGSSENVAQDPKSPSGQGMRLRIRITESHSAKPTVNLTLPLGFLDMGLGIARRVAPNRVPDTSTLKSVLLGGFKGSLVDINDDGDRVEIFVE